MTSHYTNPLGAVFNIRPKPIYCFAGIGFCSLHVEVELPAQALRFLNRCRQLSVVEIGCVGNKTKRGEAITYISYGFIQTPLGMKNQNTRSLTGTRGGKISYWLLSALHQCSYFSFLPSTRVTILAQMFRRAT
jgi:hypothetical protein